MPSIGQHGFFNNFVHAQAIGNCICLLAITITRVANHRGIDREKHGLLFILLAVPIGVYGGMFIAGWVLGLSVGPFDILQDSDQLAISALTAVIASIAFNWHLSNREKLVRLELVAAKERHRADTARLAMLQAQLEPHMLFNTLANLRALISTDTVRATEMLDRLDSFLRETLHSSQSNDQLKTVSLQHEFKILDDYLALMQIRLGKRLDFKLDLPASCHQLQIPPLLLQPLVENAIRHGIEPQVNGGRIDVSAHHNNDHLILIVADTGVGIPADQFASKTEMPPGGDNKAQVGGFGLNNLRDRLQQSFGDGAQLLLESAETNNSVQGTRIEIKIPYNATKKSATQEEQP